jgi:ribulose-5-phosphate 4-epimerase/fuculose-1-phosphate aldolase
MMEEGYIKFRCNWVQEQLADEHIINKLNPWRQKLFDQHLIGVYANGIGYGNLSIRLAKNNFIITGTATGGIIHLTAQHYTRVTGYNIENNTVTCHGPVKASSESLTHAMIYELMPAVNAIVHIHSKKLWSKLIDNVPTTSSKVEYGTPAMALEIKRLIQSTNLIEDKILVMAGHQDGVITFGRNLEEAVGKVLSY